MSSLAQAVARLQAVTSAGEARRVGKLAAHDGVMLQATGLDQPIGSTVRIGGTLSGEVVGFRGKTSLIVPFGQAAGVAAGARVEPDGTAGLVACGPELLGRVLDPLGRPLDGGPLPACRASWPLHGRARNPLDQPRVTEPLDLGVRAVNALLTAGVGQRIAIAAGSGVGKSVLMGQMLAGAECDVAVVALVGERGREVSDFLETRLTGSARRRSIVVAVPADHPPLLRLRAALRATAIAEWFRSLGQRVFLLVDSLTRVAHAQREIGLALGEPPTVKGYPPSALAVIPRLIERAGGDRRTGGAITAVYTVLADGGDTEDPVVDTARAIVDGHIILSRQLAEAGVFPAIDVGRSLSRVMADLVSPAHLAAAAHYRRLWSAWEDGRDLVMLGAYAKGSDPVLDQAIAGREAMLALLRQAPDKRVDQPTAAAALIGLFA